MTFENSLDGRCVWVTAERRSHHQRRYLEDRGATVLTVPLMQTIEDADTSVIASVTNDLISKPPDIFIAQTGQGISWWLDRLPQDKQVQLTTSLSKATVWSRGAKSTSRCRSLGLTVSWESPDETASTIAQRCASIDAGTRVAVQMVGTARDLIVDALEAVGAEVVPMHIYRYRIPDDRTPALELIEATIDGRIDAITFTASPAISNLQAIARDNSLLAKLDKAIGQSCVAAVVGPVCAATALDAGWSGVIEPDVARLIPMLDTLTNALAANPASQGPH